MAVHAVIYSVFPQCFSSKVNVCLTSLYGHVSSCTQPVAAPSPALLRQSSALCFTDYCQHLVRDDSNKVFLLLLLLIFFQVNERQLTLLNFPKVASIRQKLIVLLFLVDLFRVDLFTSST